MKPEEYAKKNNVSILEVYRLCAAGVIPCNTTYFRGRQYIFIPNDIKPLSELLHVARSSDSPVTSIIAGGADEG